MYHFLFSLFIMRNLFLLSLSCIFLISTAFAQNPATPYAVQFAAYNQPVPLSHFDAFEDAEVYPITVYSGVMIKYFSKNYTDKDKAMTLVNRAKAAGFPHATLIDMNLYQDRLSNCCSAPDGTISIQNIFFDFDRSDLRSTSKRELKDAVDILTTHPGYTIEVRAHTDAKGSNEYNTALSARRRDAAIAYLKSLGIASGRIQSSIHGEVEPVAINETNAGTDSPEGRQFNRRVELIIRDPQGTIKAADQDFVPRSLRTN